MRAQRAINSAPWEPGYYPVSVRGKNDVGHALLDSMVRVAPTSGRWSEPFGLWYFSRECINEDDWVHVSNVSCRVDMLLRPATYTIEFKGSPLGDRVIEFMVDDPYERLVTIPWRNGERLWVREGTWDSYIAIEGTYGALNVRPNDVIADMGAHIGVFARRMWHFGVSRVVCWEPEPINCELLQRNLEMTELDYEIVQACVIADSMTDKSIDLWMDPAGDGDLGRTALHSVLKAKHKRIALSVPTIPWGAELARVQPTILKVDVEGAELDYDWGLIPDSVREIALELEKPRRAKPNTHEIIWQSLRDLGFECVRHSKGWSTMEVWKRDRGV